MKTQKGAEQKLVKTILIAGAAAALIAALLSMLCALLIVNEVISQNTISYAAPIIAAISVFLCSLLAAKSTKEQKLLSAFGTAAVYFVISLIAKITFFPGNTIHMFQNGSICLGAALLAAIVASLRKGKKRYAAPKRR